MMLGKRKDEQRRQSNPDGNKTEEADVERYSTSVKANIEQNCSAYYFVENNTVNMIYSDCLVTK